jgi:thiol-disulfide isomerase/thioredoxin
VLAVSLLVLTGCDGSAPGPRESDIDVNTPKLQEQKAAVGIDDCVPGDGSSELPDLTLPCLGGGPDVDLSSLTGPLVINLWASNCGPCRQEMPALQEFYDTYGDQVGVLGIDSVDTQPEAALRLAETTGATYPQLADPGGDLYDQDDLRVAPGLPQFIVVDADGAVVKQAAGRLTSVAEVVDLVETALGITL